LKPKIVFESFKEITINSWIHGCLSSIFTICCDLCKIYKLMRSKEKKDVKIVGLQSRPCLKNGIEGYKKCFSQRLCLCVHFD
jgi:hypothetical protein